jgi:4-alpha-glucanotransferase
MKIDPMFGDEKIFKNLCKQAKLRGMSVILDGVFNHTGSDSIYFNKDGNYDSVGAYQSTKSQYSNWYRFDEYPDVYECWWGIDTLPHTNEEDESFKDFILRNEDSVVKHWLNAGARGWRLDVVDELPAHFVRDLRTAVKEVNKDAVIIGEVWEDASNKVAYSVLREYFQGDELDGVLNYPFKRAINDFLMGEIDASDMGEIINGIIANYPPQSLRASINLVGGHDTVRVKTLYGGNAELVKIAALWQMTFVGVPMIYYGDEVGMEGEADPYNRGSFPWNNVDLELRDWYKNLIHMRNENEVLQTGEFTQVLAEGDVYAYVRHTRNSAILTVLNRGEENATVTLDLSAWGGKKRQKFEVAKISGMVYDIAKGEVLV